jgi:hypothetical protein
MPNEFLPTASCIWGAPAHFNVSDLSRSYQIALTSPALSQISSTTRSAELDLGAKALRFQLAFQSPSVTCTINLYTTDGTTDALVWSSGPGINAASDDLYAGNLEYVDLQGSPVKVEVANPTGGWVSVTVLPNN